MIRKLMLPALAIALLGGCATSAYQYRGGQGDYYYGQPSTQYRYYNSPYGYYGNPYGYSGFGYGYYGYGSGFGYPYVLLRRHYRGDGHHHGRGGHGDRDHDGDRGHDGDRNDGGHHGGRDRDKDDPPDHRRPDNGGQPARPDRRPGSRPGPAWRDPGNLGASQPGRRFRVPVAHPRPAAPAVRSSRGGSIGSRASGNTTADRSTDRKRRRIHKP